MRHASRLPFAALILSCTSPLPQGTVPLSPSAATFATSSGRVVAAAIAYDTIASDDGPPLSLTGTDGSGIELTKLEARAVVEGPLAYTELHLYFHNPENRIREGRFAITLPTGAALSRFAMKNDEQWMEAEVVERMAARRAYEDFLHRRQDPALLEQAEGNEFTARVFPIPANGDKHLIVSYSQELPASTGSYVLPLRGLPAVDAVSAVVRVARADRATLAWDETTLSEAKWKPDRDFVVPVTAPLAAIASGDWLAARVAVPTDGATADAPTSLAILVDTSASRALNYGHQIEQVSALIGELARRYGGDLDLSVAAFDQDVLPIYRGRADGWTDDHDKALLARQPLGASSMAAAIAWAGAANMKRVLVIGDGVVTAGADGDVLLASIKALGAAGVERFDTALVGGIRDVDAARTWVSAGLSRDGAVLDLGAGVEDTVRRIGLAVRSDLAITVKGASWSWPERATGVQPGDELVVYAKGKAAVTNATISLGGTSVEVSGMRTDGALLSRAAAQAEIAKLERDLSRATDTKARTKLRDRIVKTSVDARVLSSLTALLVLETDADYARFGIARNALADILVVGAKGLELEHRATPVVIAQPVQPIATDDGEDNDDGKTKDKSSGKNADLYKQDEVDGRLDPGEPEKVMLDLGGSVGGESEGQAVSAATVVPAPPPPPPAPEPRAHGPHREVVDHAESGASGDNGADSEQLEASGAPAADQAMAQDPTPAGDEMDDAERNSPPALDGQLASIMKQIAAHHFDDALVDALTWRKTAPGDVLALIALGEALEAKHDFALAARAYGSLIDLFPSRADLRRFAGERLERVGEAGRALAIDSYQRAVDDRPDHLTGHRLLAMALVRAGRLADAFAALERGLGQDYPSDRFRGGTRILSEDLGLVGAAWQAKEPGKKAEIAKRLAAAGGAIATRPSMRFVLYWETDANDVDFHIRDAKHGHAWYSHKQLESGGELYEDVTTGYGPECFTIEGTPSAGPYRLKIHYYSRGPMGYGMGVLEILRHDGKGHLTFEHRPYIAMNDHAYVDLGTVE